MDARFTLDLVLALASTVARRRRSGPLHPAWGLRYESLVEAMRRTRVRLEGRPIETQRRVWDRVNLPSPSLRKLRVSESRIAGVQCHTLVPPGASAIDPALLYFHGGAWSFGSFKSHGSLVARLALASGAPVVFPAYRLAPEHPFPAAMDDAMAVYAHLVARHERVALGGDSAGGGIAAALCLRAHDEGLQVPAGAVLLSPFLDHTSWGESADRSHTDWVSAAWGKSYADGYLRAADVRHPHASPQHGDLRSLPPLLLQVGDAEILYEQAVSFADRARAAGVEVELDVEAAMAHSYHSFADVLPSCAAPIERAGRFVRRVLDRAPRAEHRPGAAQVLR